MDRSIGLPLLAGTYSQNSRHQPMTIDKLGRLSLANEHARLFVARAVYFGGLAGRAQVYYTYHSHKGFDTLEITDPAGMRHLGWPPEEFYPATITETDRYRITLEKGMLEAFGNIGEPLTHIGLGDYVAVIASSQFQDWLTSRKNI